jgi:hypothetical protein
MAAFDWHSEPLTRETPLTASYKMTQNVRRFLRAQCGDDFKFNRDFIGWVNSGAPKTMGDVADEWKRLKAL